MFKKSNNQSNVFNRYLVFYHYTMHICMHSKIGEFNLLMLSTKIHLIVRALQEAQDIFGVDFDFDEFGYGEEDEFEEEDEVSLHESAQIECTCS